MVFILFAHHSPLYIYLPLKFPGQSLEPVPRVHFAHESASLGKRHPGFWCPKAELSTSRSLPLSIPALRPASPVLPLDVEDSQSRVESSLANVQQGGRPRCGWSAAPAARRPKQDLVPRSGFAGRALGRRLHLSN